MATSLALIAGLATYSFDASAQEDPNPTPQQQKTEPSTEITKTKLDRSEKEFVKKAFHSARFTLALSQDVQERATNQRVKELAEHITTDFKKIDQELTTIGQQHGIDTPAKLPKEEEKRIESYRKMSTDKLDREFVSHLRKQLDEDIKRFTHQMEHGKTQELTNFASRTLPVLQNDLMRVREIEAELEASAKK